MLTMLNNVKKKTLNIIVKNILIKPILYVNNIVGKLIISIIIHNYIRKL